MNVTTDTALQTEIEKLQSEYDSVAFRHLYDQMSPVLYPVCLRYLKDTDEACDALQETFITIFEKIKSYTGSGSFEGWAKRITINECLKRLKKKKLKTELNESHLPSVVMVDFDKELEDVAIKKQLKEALAQLPVGYRTIINLYIIEGYTHAEIGEMLGIQEVTSRSQLNRAKQALKKLIIARK